jgi:hypothetical protein
VLERAEEGVECPCCKQNVKIYWRNIFASMVNALIKLLQNNGKNEFVHWQIYSSGSGDFAKLRYWGLIEEEKTTRPDGGSAGFWKITNKGVNFLEGNVSIPKYAVVYNGELLCLDDKETVTIKDIIGEQFNLRELMERS